MGRKGMKKIVWEWETIDKDTSRVKVLGGWWVITKVPVAGKNLPISSIFIADQHWEWQPIEPYVDPQVERAKMANDYDTGL
jgi:hypothetical protein